MATTSSGTYRTLLLASPLVATREDVIKQLFMTHGQSSTDLQMLDRMNDGLITLPEAAYDLVVVVKDSHDSPTALTRRVFAVLLPAMKIGCKLQSHGSIPLDESETREAVLIGLVRGEGESLQKTEAQDVVPLRLGARKVPHKVIIAGEDDLDLDFDLDDSDLIDENDLLTEEDFVRPNPNDLQQPKDCKKRRRACKDCTCGLAERLAAEDSEQLAKADESLNVVRLEMGDLNELDFTTIGKTGSCGNCALGDAFRCAGCPFLGFPVFKPGQGVKLLDEEVQQL